MGVLTDGCQM
ncbi:unnamed protein product, partial [Didymodactylos carnosus]